MKVSAKGMLEIVEHEGLALGPYKDSSGVWTYGVGHTNAAGKLNPEKMDKVDTRTWTKERVDQEILSIIELFMADLSSYEARVNNSVKVTLKQHQFDALVSFDFNTGGIYRANLTKDINSGNMSGNGFMGWVKPKEIIKRRIAEQNLFKTGNYEANGSKIPVYDALGDGRLRVRTVVNSEELFSKYATRKGPGMGKPINKGRPGPGILTWAIAGIGTALLTLLSQFF